MRGHQGGAQSYHRRASCWGRSHCSWCLVIRWKQTSLRRPVVRWHLCRWHWIAACASIRGQAWGLATNLEYHFHVLFSTWTESFVLIILIINQCRDEVIILASFKLQTIRLRRERAKGNCEWGSIFSVRLLIANSHNSSLVRVQPTSVVFFLRHLLKSLLLLLREHRGGREFEFG